jgi:hypothetical protein
MHWAAHGQTAAEIILQRAYAAQTNMGLTSWIGPNPRREDVTIAKNYLNTEELEVLNRIVTGYLEFAELDDFLQLGEREILTHAGRVSHQEALIKAEQQYEKFRRQLRLTPSRVEQDFENTIEQLPKKVLGNET